MVRPPRPPTRQALQRGIVILPSAFTLGNLFFGIYSMVAVSRGDFMWAGWCIIFAGVLDLLDGRIARFTRTGSAFGAELDSLVDAMAQALPPYRHQHLDANARALAAGHRALPAGVAAAWEAAA